MALQSRTITVGADRDSNNGGKNYVSGQVIYIKDELGVLAPIFRDIDGLDPIAQNTISNVTNAKGQFTFFIEEGNYTAEYNDQSIPLFVFGADYFNNQIDFVTNQILSNTQPYSAGNFTDGFTFTELNQYGNATVNDGGTDYATTFWYIGGTLPHTVAPLTNPRDFPLLYQQRDFNSAEFVATKTTENAQGFIDSFALKIFQSPTDGLTEINTRTLLGGEVYEVRKVSDDSLATIYTDKEGLNPIAQNGTSNVSGSDGVVEFHIVRGSYYITASSSQVNFSVSSAGDLSSTFNFESIADYKASKIEFPVGKVVNIVDRDTEFVVSSGTGTGNDFHIVDSDNVDQNIKIKNTSKITCKGLGMGALSDSAAALNILDSFDWDELVVEDDYFFESDVVLDLSNRKVKIHGTGSLRGVGSNLLITGSLTEVGSLTATTSVGGSSITTSSSLGVSENDILIIHDQTPFSFSSHRADYQNGEFNTVLGVSGSEISLRSGVQDAYPVGATIFKLNPVQVDLDLDLKCDREYAVTIAKSSNSTFKGEVLGGVAGALRIDKSFNFDTYNINVSCSAPANGLQYGIAVTNSQRIDVWGGAAFGTRHGTATGGDGLDGAVPNRFVNFHNLTIGNSDPTVHATDFHGNIADSHYIDCISHGHISMGGLNCGFIGGKVTAKSSTAPLTWLEVVGGAIRFEPDIVDYAAGITPDASVCETTNSAIAAGIDKDYQIILKPRSVKLVAGVSFLLNGVEASGNNAKFIVDGASLDGDNQLQRLGAFSISGAGVRPTDISITEIKGDLSGLSFMMTKSGDFSGCTVTLPSLSFRSSVSLLTGNRVSSDAQSSHPAYPATPVVFSSFAGSNIDGSNLLVASNSAQTTSSITSNVIFSDSSATASSDTNFTLYQEVSFNGVVLTA